MLKLSLNVAFSTEFKINDNHILFCSQKLESQVIYCCFLQPVCRALDWHNTSRPVNNHSGYRFNQLFHKMVMHLSLAVWFHSFLVLPAVGFKASQIDVRYRIPTWQQGAQYNPPWGSSDILTRSVGYTQYRAEPEQVEAGWLWVNSQQTRS